MANSYTDLNQTIFHQYVLRSFHEALMPIMTFSTNLSDAAASRGTQIEVLSIPQQSEAIEFQGEYTMQDSSISGKKVPIDHIPMVSWYMTDLEWWNHPRVELEMFAREKGFQLAKKVVRTIFAKITAQKFGAAGLTLASEEDFDVSDVLKLSKVLDLANWREFGRTLILNAGLDTSLRGDPAVQNTAAYGDDSVIRRGRVLSVDKFDRVLHSNLIPNNGEGLAGFAVLPEAILFASRYFAPQTGHNYHIAEPITDDETKLTIGYREWYDNDTGKRKCVYEAFYGFEVGNPAALKRIVVSA
jgi:hypothetical protein